MAIEYKLINSSFKSVGRMQQQIDLEAIDGWVVHASGPFYTVLGREPGVKRQHQVARVLFHDFDWAIRLIDERAKEGWTLAALGPNFAFFARVPDSQAPSDLRHHERSIGMMTPGALRELLKKEGHDGWTLRAMTTSHALFAKPSSGANVVEHELEAILLRTAAMTERLLAEKAEAGWRVACASRLFIAFSREILD